jgi:penicillin-binding protein 1B
MVDPNASSQRSDRPVRKWPIVGLGLGVLSGLLLIGLLTYSAVELSRFERAEARRATFVYSAGQSLAPGVHVGLVDLAGILKRLKYTEARTPPTAPGQFQRMVGAWEIFLRGAGRDRAQRVRLEVQDERIVRVTRDGEQIGVATLEPEPITSAGHRPGEDHRPVRLAEVPPVLIGAVLAVEDHRFFEHGGLDVRGLARAAWANLRAGRVVQGGSTITQQLVKIRLLGPQRTLLRKLYESWLSALLESRYSKDRILEAYLNELYLGQRGALAIRGVGAAARAYFGKDMHQLTLGEAALLAGMARAPNSYSPLLNPGRARERRDVVLARMRDLGKITEPRYRTASREPVRVRPAPALGQLAPYFADYVRQEVEQRFGPEIVWSPRGARIFTALDPVLQQFAEAAVARGLDRLEGSVPRLRRRDPRGRLQAVLIALDPATGQIRSLVGGRDYHTSQFNRAILARRQPGSAFKPVLYLAALAPREGRPAFTAASFVDDAPITLSVAGTAWSPRNYEDKYEGRVSLRRALEGSLNTATVRIAQAIGLPAVIETARALGIRGGPAPVPAVALGAFEVTPLELARGYLPLANGGLRPQGPAAIRAVDDGDGRELPLADDPATRVLSPAEAYLMTSLLEGVINSGTARAVRELGVSHAVAGKTGTTNDGRDAWFVGYSSTLLALVWVGFDSGETHGLSGAEAALPIWADFIKRALDVYPPPPFTAPPGITFADIDTTNGKVANRFCPVVARETFLAGTEPEVCDEHGSVTDRIVNWWERFRNWLRR